MTTHPKPGGTGGTTGTPFKENGKPCPATENETGTVGTMKADDLAARVAALAERMRAGAVPRVSVPPVPPPETVPGQVNASDINTVPPAPAVPVQNGKPDPLHELACDDARRWRDLFEERAAIREHDGGLCRADAEAGALADLAQRWRCENPLLASNALACAHCGNRLPDTPVLARGGQAWLHKVCWGPMNEARQREALAKVQALLGASP